MHDFYLGTLGNATGSATNTATFRCMPSMCSRQGETAALLCFLAAVRMVAKMSDPYFRLLSV